MQQHSIHVSGAVTYWTIGTSIRREDLDHELDSRGLSRFTPCPRTDDSALALALAQVFDGATYLVRPLDKRNTNGRLVVKEVRGADRNTYLTVARARVADGEVHVTVVDADYLPVPQSALDSDLQLAFLAHKAFLAPSAVGEMLVKLAAERGGLTLRPSGSVYWLPEAHLALWGDLAGAIERLDASGKTAIYLLRTAKDADALRAVRDAITAEIEREAGSLCDEISAGLLGQKALLHRQQVAMSLEKRVAQYEQILGQGLDSLSASCKQARRAAVTALMGQVPGELLPA